MLALHACRRRATGVAGRFWQAPARARRLAGRCALLLGLGLAAATLAGGSELAPPASASTPAASVSLAGSATFAVAGDRETIGGRVRLGAARRRAAERTERVLLQSETGGVWRTAARLRVRGGDFSMRRMLRRPGGERWRAVLPAGGRHPSTISPVLHIDVAPFSGIHKIRHVVVIMQENRSFDSYFGTYPGADGIPPGICVPDPLGGGCVKPFHDSKDLNRGGPHLAADARADVAGGAMNGFIGRAEEGQAACAKADVGRCSPCARHEQGHLDVCALEVMGYHDAREIPNYWTYAKQFVLQDHMFSSVGSWSLPAHLYLVSGWSALCTEPFNPDSCHTEIEQPANPPLTDPNPTYAWTDITWLLHRQHVSWGYYVFMGLAPECVEDPALACVSGAGESGSGSSSGSGSTSGSSSGSGSTSGSGSSSGSSGSAGGPGTSTGSLSLAGFKAGATPSIWDPLREFTDVHEDRQLGNVRSIQDFLAAAKRGALPSVSWIAPSRRVSEHPPALVSAGQEYVTGLIDAIMEGPDWKSTAIFVSWDDWGGFYDNVAPPVVDAAGYGLRVPGLVISPYAKQGFIDHQTLSHDAYDEFIENDFLGGERLNPATDGRPDPRPDVREESPILGNLEADFNFDQRPRPPLILPLRPPPGPASGQP